MKYKKFVRLYSNSRILKYYKATGKNPSKAIKLYNANLKISQAFYPLLGCLEVILRNQLHYALAKSFNDSNWIINQKTGFMIHPSLTYKNQKKKTVKNYYLLNNVQDAEKNLTKKRVVLTPGRIIAEQTLGFWTSMYDKTHYTILKGIPGSIFRKLPTGYGRKEISKALKDIRDLRNRISHCEPICFVNGKCDFSYVENTHKTIIDFLSWIDPDIPTSLRKIDKVGISINNAKSILNP